MAAEIEIPESVVEAACLSLAKQEGLKWPDDYGRDVEQLRPRIAKALCAAMAELLEPVGFTSKEQLEDMDRSMIGIFRRTARRKHSISLFRIRGQE